MTKKLQFGDKCDLLWKDSINYPGWHKEEECIEIAQKVEPMLDFGKFYVGENEEFMTIAQGCDTKKKVFANLMKIPKSCIQEVIPRSS